MTVAMLRLSMPYECPVVEDDVSDPPLFWQD